MTRVSEMVDDVLAEGVFDRNLATRPLVLRALTRRHRTLVARSRIRRATIELGPTVPNESSYSLPDSVLELMDVTLNGTPYGRGRHTDLAKGAQGWVLLTGPGGITAPDEGSGGARAVAFFPTPTDAGLPIQAHVVLRAETDLDETSDAALLTPPEYDEALYHGAISTIMASGIGDFRADIAQPYEAEFQQACQELRLSVNNTYRGAGPAQIRVVGVNA